ncbi:di-heme cytochrome c peroxidase [Pacificibacter maritimus]|uniref:Di-heme cytochrome c peroxidase n=1 Tax=Pacificibacter maritimus TaxID=762213 RepID=A0A3N4UJE7_9RHOB|nr:hypothetical protein [Pacificibacter maritimus]RPE67399.1 di-heme cytochrome c peroxidase [Pacificibacter maritimus]
MLAPLGFVNHHVLRVARGIGAVAVGLMAPTRLRLDDLIAFDKDQAAFGIGEGGLSLGPSRTTGEGSDRIRKRIPRNAPALWNLGAREIHTLFHDGRLMASERYENGFDSPAEEWLPQGFNSLLAVQAIFPLVAQFEMAGNPRENEIAGAVHDRIDAAYPTLEGIVRHHIDAAPIWTRDMAQLPQAEWLAAVDFAAQDDRFERQRHARVRDTTPIALTQDDITALVHFLNALTGTSVTRPPFGVPTEVPSGLPLD